MVILAVSITCKNASQPYEAAKILVLRGEQGE